ncbi:MAG: lysophospholipid acyltransferase family protein [Kiritimatiellia bacterium]
MKPRPWYRAWPETAALLFGISWIPLLPRCAVLALSRGFGNIGFRFANELKRVGMANLDIVYGDTRSPAEKEEILRKCYQHFALLVLDIIWFAFFPKRRLEKWFRWDPSTSVMFEAEAQLELTAHYGNWETLGQAFALRGAPIFSVAAPLKNRSADKVFIWLRQRTGQVIIPQQGAARRLLQGLRKQHKLAVLLDQNTRPRDGGIFVDVFGLSAPVSSAPAALAVKTGAHVVTVLAVPDEKGVYTVTVHDTMRARGDVDDPVAELTQRMTDSVTRVIRETPQYWCWMYKRWRFIPEGADADRYPWYARRVEPGDFKK